MANLKNTPIHLLSSEHYRQMLVRDGDRRFREWHGEYLKYQTQFLNDQKNRAREMEDLRKEIYAG